MTSTSRPHSILQFHVFPERPARWFCLLISLLSAFVSSLSAVADTHEAHAGNCTTAVRDPETLHIVTLGDSITKGVRTGVLPEQTFSAILEAQLHSQQIAAKVTNTGIGGERTDQALKRLDADILSLKPDIVIVMYGTNDSYVDQGATDSRISADEFETNLRQIVAKLRENQVSVVIMTEPAWGTAAGVNGVGEHPNLRLEKYMARTRGVAKSEKVPLVDHYDLWTTRLPEGTTPGDLTTDQCHPNPRGHQFMAEQILPVLLEQFKKVSRDSGR